MFRNRTGIWIIIAAACVFILSCQTADLIGALAQNNQSPKPTRLEQDGSGTTTSPRATRDPDAGAALVPASTPRCTAGDNAASIVSGTVTENGAPVAGVRVQASAGEGGEPISDEPAHTDANGDYQITFACNGKACDGSFWVWIIDEDGSQISPFIKFVFDDRCRRGTVDFSNP